VVCNLTCFGNLSAVFYLMLYPVLFVFIFSYVYSLPAPFILFVDLVFVLVSCSTCPTVWFGNMDLKEEK
jgi:hypothetical protein